MLILLHILYIYTEYIWSYIVNRKNNRSADEPFISEINPSNEIDDGDKKSDLVVLNSEKFLVSESVAAPEPEKFDVGCTLPSDNLENDLSTKDAEDKFIFDDSLEEFEHAVYDRDTKQIRFFPPVYIQRYITAVNVLKDSRWSAEIKKVVDIGCSEFGFFKFLKHVEGIEHIVEVDTDRVILEGFKYRVQPWVSDYVRERERPLEVTILCGNASRPDCHLEGADAVVAIELIEHLFPDDLEELPFNIFGLIKPRIAIFTTPNQDFNVLFGDFSGFRHADHKFEWSRELFINWAKNICDRYPYYEVSFIGIGPSPKGKEEYGFCSQGAVFVRLDSHLPVEDFSLPPLSSFEEYDIIDHVEYPFKRDTRPEDKITLDDASNFINLAVQAGDYCKGEQSEVPLTAILMRVYKTCAIIDKLKEILQDGGYTIGRNSFGDLIVIVPKLYLDSETSEDEVEQCIVHEYTDASLEDDWDTMNEEQVNESSASDETQLSKVDYIEETECSKLITYSELMVDKVKSDLKDVANNFYCQFNDVKLPFDICTQLNISKSPQKSDENFTTSNSAIVEKPNFVIDLTSSLESYALSGSTSDSNYMNSCAYSSVSLPTSTNSCRNNSDTLESEMRNASINSGNDFRTTKSLCENEQRKDLSETMLENNDSLLVNSINSSLSKITLSEDFVADEDDSQSGTLDSSSHNVRNFMMERISEEDLKDDVELSVGSAYSVDECVENVQARIKGFNSECGNLRDVNCSSELESSSDSLLRCFSNQQLVSEVDKYSGKESRNDTLNLETFDDLMSRNGRYHQSNNEMILTSKTQSNVDLVNIQGVSSNRRVSESNLVANDVINDQTYRESNFSSKSPVSVQCSSSLCTKEAPTVLQPGQLENIFEEVNILDLNKKVGENDHDGNDKYMYYCLNCSSVVSNQRELCQSTSEKSADDLLKTSEEMRVNSSNNCTKNVPACSNCRCSSSLMLFEDQSREVIVNTHDFQNDIQIDGSVSKGTLKTDKDLVLSGDNKLLKSSNKGCDRFVRSSSLGEFDPYPVSKGTFSFFESNVTKDMSDFNAESFAEQYVFNHQSDECLNADAERQDSCSPDKAADSGYPNSNSGQDMEMDLTPEQVKEIITESESSIENSPLDSPVLEEAAAVQNGVAGIPHPPLVHLGDNVENGDVANNNRDGEGNNMVGEADVNVVVGEPREFHAVIDHPQEMALMDAAGCNFTFEENVSMSKIEADNGADAAGCNFTFEENVSMSKIEADNGADAAGCNFTFEENVSMSKIEADNGAVDDEQSDYLSCNKNTTTINKSITFIVDQNVSQHSTDSDKLSFRLSVTETSCSCPESTIRFTDDETDESASVVSVNNVKEWESIKMVQSFKVKDLKKYESWLVEKMNLDRASVNPGDDLTSINGTESTQSCASEATVDCSLAISHSVPDQLFSACTVRLDRPTTSRFADELQSPMSLVDRALNPYIQEIVSEFISANSEPFADWLLQIQLDGSENDVPLDVDNVQPALRIIEELNNDFLHTDSSVEMTVEPDVKGGGDRT